MKSFAYIGPAGTILDDELLRVEVSGLKFNREMRDVHPDNCFAPIAVITSDSLDITAKLSREEVDYCRFMLPKEPMRMAVEVNAPQGRFVGTYKLLDVRLGDFTIHFPCEVHLIAGWCGPYSPPSGIPKYITKWLARAARPKGRRG